jgi:hypothetical protein
MGYQAVAWVCCCMWVVGAEHTPVHRVLGMCGYHAPCIGVIMMGHAIARRCRSRANGALQLIESFQGCDRDCRLDCLEAVYGAHSYWMQ